MDSTIVAALITAGAGVLVATIPILSWKRRPENGVTAQPIAATGVAGPPPAGVSGALPAGALEVLLRADPTVGERLSHSRDQRCAEAAILFLCRGTQPPVRDWPKARTWQIVEAAYKKILAAQR